MYKVLLVDDQQLFRDIARTMFEADGGFEIAGEAEDGADAPVAYASLAPDLVLMDVEMPRMGGFEATRQITEEHPGAVIVLTSMNRDPSYDSLAAQVGAAAFFIKRDLDIAKIKAMLGDRAGQQGTQAAA